MSSISDKMEQLLTIASARAIETLQGGGQLIPFVMLTKGERIMTEVFPAQKLEEGVEQARRFVDETEEDPDLYVIAYDGRAMHEGDKKDAVVMEIGEKGVDNSSIAALIYKSKGFLQGFKVLAQTIISQSPNRLRR